MMMMLRRRKRIPAPIIIKMLRVIRVVQTSAVEWGALGSRYVKRRKAMDPTLGPESKAGTHSSRIPEGACQHNSGSHRPGLWCSEESVAMVRLSLSLSLSCSRSSLSFSTRQANTLVPCEMSRRAHLGPSHV